MSGSTSFVARAPSPTLTLISDAALAQSRKPTLNSIERNYQVKEEASKDWSPKLFGSIPVGEIGGKVKLTLTEGKLLDNLTRDRGILGLREFKGIAEDAFATSEARVPPSTAIPTDVMAKINALPTAKAREDAIKGWPTNDGHTDAFRHAYWNARMTSEFGAEWTRQFATAHEGANTDSSTREAMDLYNNEIGRQIAIGNPNASLKELADLVKKALDNGDLVVVDGSGHLNWSNKVANGNHGVTIQLNNVPAALNTPSGNAPAS